MAAKFRESAMLGRITKFSPEVGFGVIEAENGAKYRFAKNEVVNLNGKLVGHSVDFLVSARRGKEIFLMTGTPWTAFGGGSH
jgi:cold shock CspA family protein